MRASIYAELSRLNFRSMININDLVLGGRADPGRAMVRGTAFLSRG
jgi:hypothetical protein